MVAAAEEGVGGNLLACCRPLAKRVEREREEEDEDEDVAPSFLNCLHRDDMIC